jgi:hypothetical protein
LKDPSLGQRGFAQGLTQGWLVDKAQQSRTATGKLGLQCERVAMRGRETKRLRQRRFLGRKPYKGAGALVRGEAGQEVSFGITYRSSEFTEAGVGCAGRGWPAA